MSCPISTRLWIRLIYILAATLSIATIAHAADAINENAFNRCRAISDETAWLHCFESLTSQTPKIEPSSPQNNSDLQSAPDRLQDPTFGPQTTPSNLPIAGKWRLVRTPNPRDGQDVISIMTTAELSGSDPDFAGLVLRCADPDFETLVFLINPLPPRARPTISINGKEFEGSVIPPGASVLLPRTATALVKEQWRLT